ncbi:MAG: radical SAM protein [Lachnospiraceae bacterium]
MTDSINIIIPDSITSNNIYSFSEVIYMTGYLKKNGVMPNLHIADTNYLKVNSPVLSGGKNILVLMWDGEELIRWLDAYGKYIATDMTILFGLTAQIYGKFLKADYKYITGSVMSYSYLALLNMIYDKNAAEYQKPDISELEYPEISLELLKSIPMIPVISSRGCMNNCNFCAVSSIGRLHHEGYQSRKWESVYKEILAYTQAGYSRFYFVDSCFVSLDSKNRENIVRLCKKIISDGLKISFYMETRVDTVDIELFRLLKMAGLRRVLLGVENISSQVLKYYNKKIDKNKVLNAITILKDLEINMDLTMILFDPMTTIDYLKENITFISEYDLVRYIGLKGVFRRLIIIPDNTLPYDCSTLEFDKKAGIPDWMSKTVCYHIKDTKVELFEQFVKAKAEEWIEYQDSVVRQINNIRQKKETRQELDNLFLQIVRELLSEMNVIQSKQELDEKFEWIKKERIKVWSDRK